MKTATFICFICFLLFALIGATSAMPEPVQAGSIVARDADAAPAEDGLGELIARGDDDHHNDYCWKNDGWNKCGKWNYCCKKYQTCCGGKKCCDKGQKCVRKYWNNDDDDHHKRGDNNNYHYEWVCKKDDHHW
ncbi:transmembrane protein, putative, partial [Rhizoctonia solani AG-3 Rhs1AP]